MDQPDRPPGHLDECVDYVRRRHDGDPLDRLFVAVAVAEHLTRLADELIGTFVDEARSTGVSWTQIGESLGVTKQAAQRRFVGNAAAALQPAQPAGPPAWMSEDTVALVEQSRREAQECGHDVVVLEHVLLAALHDPHGLPYQAIQAVGASPQTLRAAVLAGMPPRQPPTDMQVGWTVRAKEVLDARRIAKRQGRPQVSPEHILLNLLGSRKGGPVLKTLKQFGVSEKPVRRWLDHHHR